MNTELITAIVHKKDKEAADAIIKTMDPDRIKNIIGQFADQHGEQLFNYLSDYFYRSRHEAVLPAIHELCVIHIAHLNDIEIKHLELVQKAVTYYPNNLSYRKLLHDFTRAKQATSEVDTVDWTVSFKHQKEIFHGNYDTVPHPIITIAIDDLSIPLENILQNNIKDLEDNIGHTAFESILTQGKIIKKRTLDFDSYKTEEGYNLYFWMAETLIIIVSFTEIQPARYLCRVEFTCLAK